jgi:hypothetical protein
MARNQQIEASLDAVMAMDRASLADCWMSVFGASPPKNITSEFMRQAIGWQVQAQLHGGLDAKTRRLLISGLAEELLSVGTQLIRQWQGQTHQVTVLATGFEYQGKIYRSLSAISRVITGTSWNGLVFFGVKK